MFSRLTATGIVWPDGRSQAADVVLWGTGFRPDLAHLSALGLRGASGHIAKGAPARSTSPDST